MKKEHKRPAKKKAPNKDYPRLSFRIQKTMLQRLEALRETTDMSLGQMVNACLNNHLPELETRHGIKA